MGCQAVACVEPSAEAHTACLALSSGCRSTIHHKPLPLTDQGRAS